MTRAAVLGGGVIGGGWAARFLLNGWDVAIYDPDPKAPAVLDGVLARARASLPGLTDTALPSEGEVIWAGSAREAVDGAAWVQESVPERLDLKHALYADVLPALNPGTVFASSTSGFKPSELDDRGRVVVAHPFNPVYLMPLVELVGAERETLEAAAQTLRTLGMYPLILRKEIDAHIADRLLEAVWREALWLVKDGIATTEEIDDAIRMGFGLRWAQMGLFETYRCAGGADGMRHFLAQFGPALKWPWTKLMDVPDYDDALVDLIAGQSDAQSGHLSIDALLDRRDANLVAILRALKCQNWGAGAVLNAHQERLRSTPPLDKGPITTLDRTVPLDWTDYNGHMNEARYLQAFGDATDRFMALIGCDDDYIAAGGSYFTAETHICHLGEAHAGTRIHATTQVLLGKGKKLHLFHRLFDGETLIATGEHFLIHVDLGTRRPSEPSAAVMQSLEAVETSHADLPVPEGAGRAVGTKPS